MSAVMTNRPGALAMNVRERSRGWLNAVNLHWAGVGLLALVNLFLLVNMGISWQQANSQNAAALADQQTQLKTAEIAAKPLQGLDVKIAASTKAADRFYMERLPISYSEIASELGVLKAKTNVRLTGANYTQLPVAGDIAANGPGGQLTEVNIDARLTGDYRPLVLFLNCLERDKLFFLVNGVALTGQQTGLVSLRMRITTYIRGTVSPDELQKASFGDPSQDELPKAAAGGAR